MRAEPERDQDFFLAEDARRGKPPNQMGNDIQPSIPASRWDGCHTHPISRTMRSIRLMPC